MKNIDNEGCWKISRGNKAAHEDDTIVDADLYTSGERKDELLLLTLYGLDSHQISYLCKCQSCFLSLYIRKLMLYRSDF